jgi:DNA-nicking Smr family endonuclease
MSGGRRKRTLTADEVSLWSFVTRHVEPIRQKNIKPELPLPAASEPLQPSKAEPPLPVSKAEKNARPMPPPAAKPFIPSPPPLPPLAPIERRLRQRLTRGDHPVDSVIDLHGKRQDEAHEALRRFIVGAQAMGYSVILVVTGKGASGSDLSGLPDERGVLRRIVPHWLRMPDMRPFVIGFETAAQHHGGAGALYVRIRRKRHGGSS